MFDHPRSISSVADEASPPMLWYPNPEVSGCRLSLDRTRSVPNNDQTEKKLIYVVPHTSNTIECWSGEDWVPRRVPYDLGSTQTRNVLAVDLAGLPAATTYDIYVRNVSGQWEIKSWSWGNTAQRVTSVPANPDIHPDGLGLFQGRLVWAGQWTASGQSRVGAWVDPSWLYLGTFYTSATGQTEDSLTKRLLYSFHNQVDRRFQRIETTTTWTYATTAWRQANASASNQVACVTGLSQYATVGVIVGAQNSAADASVGIGVGGTTPHADSFYHYGYNTYGERFESTLRHIALGYRYYTWCELRVSTGTVTFNGTLNYAVTGLDYSHCGMYGGILA